MYFLKWRKYICQRFWYGFKLSLKCFFLQKATFACNCTNLCLVHVVMFADMNAEIYFQILYTWYIGISFGLKYLFIAAAYLFGMICCKAGFLTGRLQWPATISTLCLHPTNKFFHFLYLIYDSPAYPSQIPQLLLRTAAC